MPNILNRLTRVEATLILAASLLLLFWNSFPANAQSHHTGSAAEWDKAKVILVHTPGNELFPGMIHPEAALYEAPFNIQEAADEHLEYVEKLKSSGVEKVFQVSEILLQDPSTLKDLIVELDLLEFSGSNWTDDDQKAQEKYFENNLEELQGTDPSVLVWMALNQPKIRLTCSEYGECGEGDYNVVADYQTTPLMNMYFTRDQVITTAEGVVIGKMKDTQREKETKIIELVLNNLDITPVYEITGDAAVLEGGDFIPAGQRVFIGQGLRTNAEAIKKMLENNVFGDGVEEVIVVKEKWQNQHEMHLDTYFNIAAETTAVLVADRFPENCESAGGGTPGNDKCLHVDVWERTTPCSGEEVGDYCLTAENTDKEFVQLLGEVGFENIIQVSVADQIAYGINFLTVEENEIIGVDGVSPGYKTALENAGVTATWIDFDNMKLGYGAAHCTTQVLSRIALP